MDAKLEVYFCDLCNTSVPASDLGSGRATWFKDRVIGACCLPGLRAGAEDARPKEAAPRSVSPRLAGLCVILLAAIAGAAAFLDWRVTDEAGRMGARVGVLEQQWGTARDRIAQIESGVGLSAGKADVAALAGRFDRTTEDLQGLHAALGTAQSELRDALSQVAGLIRAQEKTTLEQGTALARIEQGLQHVSSGVARIEAEPRGARVPEPAGEAAPSPSAPPDPDLPQELQHQVASLADGDASARFIAVDKLIGSRNQAVRPHLIPMVKDPDPFVRRLTVEGLRNFRHADTVEALIVALGDAESIVRHAAFVSLRTLTGQTLEFDSDAPANTRMAAQRRWREWWDKNRDKF
jgi:hypothetical protein